MSHRRPIATLVTFHLLLIALGVMLLAATKVQAGPPMPIGALPGGNSTPTATSTTAPTPGCGVWNVVSSPNNGSANNRLNDIAIVSPNDIWAVGVHRDISDNDKTLTMHWDGSQWSIVPSPSPGTNNTLAGVAAVAANDVWAVGFTGNLAAGQTIILHWDGATWNTNPASLLDGLLMGVAAVSANDVWAVGTRYAAGIGALTFTMRWNGTKWGVAPSPSPTNNDLLWAVEAVSAGDVWAVGHAGPQFSERTLTMHWDGTQWSVVPSPNIGTSGNRLWGVSATSAGDVWAVGITYEDNAGTIIMRWDGSAWKITPSSITADAYLYGVEALSANDAWAVGVYTDSGVQRPLLIHWDGAQWALTPAPPPAVGGQELSAVAAVSSQNVWAVGVSYPDSQGRTLVMRYPGQCATPTSTRAPPTGTSTPTPTPSVKPVNTATPTPPTTPTPPSATPTECAITFPDVRPADYFYEAVRYLYCHGAVSGYSDGTFRPFKNTTRGQLCKIVVLAEGWGINTKGGPHFSDVTQTNTFYPYIETAYNREIISGYGDGTFRPGNDVTRGQLCKIVALAEGWEINTKGGPHFSDVPNTHAHYAYIETAYNRNIISGYGDGTFRPGSPATRGQICKIVYNAISAPAIQAMPLIQNDGQPAGNLSPTLSATTTATSGCRSWEIVSSPNSGNWSSNRILDLAVVSANDIWAVGIYMVGSREQTLTMHWDGIKWSIVSSPNPSEANVLLGVSAISANDVWAVGYVDRSAVGPLILHWDGHRWNMMPRPARRERGMLTDVAAISANDVWAVGMIPGNVFQTLAMHWNGTQWSVVPTPSASGYSWISAVSASSANDVWAVGYHGSYGNPLDQTLTMHWNGAKWSLIPSPNVGTGSNYLEGIAAVSTTDAWAVGYYDDTSTNAGHRLVMRWDGAQWSAVPTPDVGVGDNAFHAVAYISTTEVWAVGGYTSSINTPQTLIMRWDGTQWSIVPSPNVASSGQSLEAIAAVSTGNIWAAGRAYWTGTLVLRYLDHCASPTPP